ncbi:hypothetical protein Ahia01_000136900 [Argonauta hians]
MQASTNSGNDSLSRRYTDKARRCPFKRYLYLLHVQGSLCDVQLRIGNNAIPAHYIILASASEFFRTMCVAGKHLDLSGLIEDPKILKIIVQYIYTSKIKLSLSRVRSLLDSLTYIDVGSLKKHCEQYLFEQLQPKRLFETWELAWRYELNDLSVVCIALYHEIHCDKVLQCERIKHLSIEFIDFLTMLIPTIANLSPTPGLKLLYQWLSHDTESRIYSADNIIKNLLPNKVEKDLLGDVNTFLESYQRPVESILKDAIRAFLLDAKEDVSTTICRKMTKRFFELTGLENRAGIINDSNTKLSLGPLQENSFSLKNSFSDLGRNSTVKVNFTTESQRSNGFIGQMHYTRFGSPASEDCESIKWSIIVQESNLKMTAVYCSNNDNWYNYYTPKGIYKPIGFVNNDLICQHNVSGILAHNLTSMVSRVCNQQLPDINSAEEYIFCHGNSQVAYFIYSNSLYTVSILKHHKVKTFRIIISRWDYINNVCRVQLSVHPSSPAGSIRHASLTVRTSTGPNIYIMVTVLTRKRDISSQSKPSNEFSFHPNELFYIFKADIEAKTFEQIGFRPSEPPGLHLMPTIILEDCIIFILRTEDMITSFTDSFNNDTSIPLYTLVFYIKSNSWKCRRLLLPLPPFSKIPVKHSKGESYLKVNISFFKHFMLLGLHRAPYIYQIAMYDLSKSQVFILKPLPLPSVNTMTICLVESNTPKQLASKKYLSEVNMSTFYFEKWLLESWEGDTVSSIQKSFSTSVKSNYLNVS